MASIITYFVQKVGYLIIQIENVFSCVFILAPFIL